MDRKRIIPLNSVTFSTLGSSSKFFEFESTPSQSDGKNGIYPPVVITPLKGVKFQALDQNSIRPPLIVLPPPITPVKPLTIIIPPTVASSITQPKPGTVIPVSPGVVKGTKVQRGDEYFKNPAALSDRDKKYCRCVLHVQGKQVPECLQDKAWFKNVGGKQCYNPYAVCAKSTHHTSRECGKNYDWSGIPDNEIEGYAHINHISVPSPFDRTQMINNILAWKRREGKI
uniref:HeH/LEM domain protein n=1 Tax=Pithovirus LCPAC201 TaxID=2506591 RepID=A0A481Z704_9VIRU|nr:MAG: HeH/LEM domain protein [Pithovirus LCPAC201]